MNIIYHEGYNALENLEAFIKDNADKVTVLQAVALYRVRRRWLNMTTPYIDTINDCIMVNVAGNRNDVMKDQYNNAMVLGIEKDGYTHS